MASFKTFQALSKNTDQNRWMEWIFHGNHFRLHLPHSSSPVALQTVLPSSPALIPAPLSVKSPRIAPQRSNNRTALPSIRIANPAAVKCRAQSQTVRRKRSACVCAWESTKWQNYILKESGESIPAFVGSFSAGNWTISNRHGTVLFLNLKTLKCPYLYASANSGNTALWLKCKRVNNIRTVKVECSRKWINCVVSGD